MGAKERIITNESIRDTQEMALTRNLFPKGAIINDLGGGNYDVEADFEDDLFLSGGQKIELDLEKKFRLEPGIRFEVKKFVVNSQKIDNEETKINILGSNLPEKNKNDPLDIEEYRTVTRRGQYSDIIFFNSFRTSAVLATYFHELGHLNRRFDDIPEIELYDNLNKVYELFRDENKKLTPELKESFRKYIYEERQANLKSLEIAKLYKKIFDDRKISELKMFHSIGLSRCIRYSNVFTPSETITIVDMDQDWHY